MPRRLVVKMNGLEEVEGFGQDVRLVRDKIDSRIASFIFCDVGYVTKSTQESHLSFFLSIASID